MHVGERKWLPGLVAFLVGVLILGVTDASAVPEADNAHTDCGAFSSSPSLDDIGQALASLIHWLLGSSPVTNCASSTAQPPRAAPQTALREIDRAQEDELERFHLPLGYTLSDLIRLEERQNLPSLGAGDLHLEIGENIDLLARHIDLTRNLIRMVFDARGEPYPDELSGAEEFEEFVLGLGGVASLTAKVDFMTGLTQYLVHSLMSSEVPPPVEEEDVTLVLNVSGGLGALDVATVLQGPTLQPLGSEGLSAIGIREITVKVSNGTVTSEAELDPADLTIRRGQLEFNFQFGTNTITSATTFSRGEGLEKQILKITAQLGSVDFIGQALFTSGLQEFKLQASLQGLTFSTLLTPQGFSQPTLGFDWRF